MKSRAWIVAGAVVIAAGGGIGAVVATGGSPTPRTATAPAHRTAPSSTTTSTTSPLQGLTPRAEAAGNGPPPTSALFCTGSLPADQAAPPYPASYPLVNGQTCFDQFGSFVHLGKFPAQTTAPKILRNGGWFRIS